VVGPRPDKSAVVLLPCAQWNYDFTGAAAGACEEIASICAAQYRAFARLPNHVPPSPTYPYAVGILLRQTT